jgi:hypothetical protein
VPRVGGVTRRCLQIWRQCNESKSAIKSLFEACPRALCHLSCRRALERERSAEKKIDEFYAKVFEISLATVFVLILILDAASSSTRTYSDHRAEFAGIGANLEPFAQARSGFAATDGAYATRPASQPLD